jgi:hypothetical protein
MATYPSECETTRDAIWLRSCHHDQPTISRIGRALPVCGARYRGSVRADGECKLAAPAGIEDRRSSMPNECLDSEVDLHCNGDSPSQNPSAVPIQHHRQMDEASRHRKVGRPSFFRPPGRLRQLSRASPRRSAECIPRRYEPSSVLPLGHRCGNLRYGSDVVEAHVSHWPGARIAEVKSQVANGLWTPRRQALGTIWCKKRLAAMAHPGNRNAGYLQGPKEVSCFYMPLICDRVIRLQILRRFNSPWR